MDAEINKELIFSHFDRKTSPLQREMIAQWLKLQPNEELYYEWLEEWEMKYPQYRAQTDTALQHYTTFLTENPHSAAGSVADDARVRPFTDDRNWRQWLVAASVVLLLGLGSFLFRNAIQYQTFQTAFGETRSLQLPDGSKVVLNANSSLRIPRWGFGHKTREVWLTGEAAFSITHTADDQKFVVKTANRFDVVVLGTEFSVFARKRGARVVLNKGKVQLNYQEGQTTKQVTLKPGDLVTLDSENHAALKTLQQPQQQLAWQGKRFVFDETTLQEVAYLLEENYGLQVSIKDRVLAERVLMGSFRADNVDQLLQSISELLDISVVRQGNQVKITGQ